VHLPVVSNFALYGTPLCKYITYIVSPFLSDRPQLLAPLSLPSSITCDSNAYVNPLPIYSRSHREDIRPTISRRREQIPFTHYPHKRPLRSIILAPLSYTFPLSNICESNLCYRVPLSVGCFSSTVFHSGGYILYLIMKIWRGFARLEGQMIRKTL
jgi:hypothetical protein